ncbi:MAG TPA: glycosyltransferase, partial [Gemmataceae bacterium]
LQHFSDVLTVGECVHFLGARQNVSALLAEVDMVWIPSYRNTGVNTALEAMAAGRPLVATRMPILLELLPTELRPHLVATKDQGSLARQTRLLLNDRDRCAQLGEIGRRHVAEHFPLKELLERSACLYEEVSQ